MGRQVRLKRWGLKSEVFCEKAVVSIELTTAFFRELANIDLNINEKKTNLYAMYN